jgi:hypothetical protein
MDENIECRMYRATVLTPKTGRVTTGQIAAVAARSLSFVTEATRPQSVVLTLKVVKNDIAHTYRSISDFERSNSDFDVFNQFDVLILPSYEEHADGQILRLQVRREGKERIEIDLDGNGPDSASSCTEEVRRWLDGFFNKPAVPMSEFPSVTIHPEIPVFKVGRDEGGEVPIPSVTPESHEPEERNQTKRKSYIRRNLVEIIFAILGAIGFIMIVASLIRFFNK